MEQNKRIVVTEYSKYPGPRYSNQGDSSGEDFYHSVLNISFSDALLSKKKLEVVLDGTAGFASSFLDEAFGNLIYDFSIKIVKPNILIISKQEPDWKDMISNNVFIDWEQRRIDSVEPKKTETHTPWFRWVGDKLEKNEGI